MGKMKLIWCLLIFCVICKSNGDICTVKDNVCAFANVVLSEIKNLESSPLYDHYNIEMVTFKHCELCWVPKEIFTFFKNMRSLHMNDQKVDRIEPNTFDSASNLEILHLQKNSISRLGKNSFFGANKLKELYLYNNQLGDNISADAFNGLLSLEILSLSANHIATLPDKVFEPLENLRVLGLRDNKILNLQADLFDSNLNLKEIHLYNNKLFGMSKNMFSRLTELDKLLLKRNDCVDENWLSNAYQNITDIEFKLTKCDQGLKYFDYDVDATLVT